MKNIRFNLVLIVFLTFNISRAISQSSSNYTFSTTITGSLTDITSSSSILINSSVDDGVSSVSNIGFDFLFMGRIYTQFSVNSNGLLKLGSTVITTSNSNNLTSTTNLPIIAPFWDNLQVSSSGKVHCKLIGSFPNRILIVEWKNMEINSSSSTSDGTFQCRLYETTGVIEFVYGSMAIGTSSSTVTASIGFSNGNSNSNLVSVTSISTPAVTTSTAGVNNSLVNSSSVGAITGLNSVADGSRRIYKFTPSVTSAPSSLSLTSINAYGMKLNWTDNSSDELGFVILQSTDGINYYYYSQVAANSTSSIIIGLNAATLYYWKVYALREVLSSACSNSASTISTIGNITVISSGNWSNPSIWSTGIVPTIGDNVTIADNNAVTIDVDAFCNSLTIGSGNSGNLVFEQSIARTLSVNSNITIESTGTFTSNLFGTQTGHNLIVNGSIINNGTLDFSTNSNTAASNIIFTGSSNATFSGIGATTDIKTITLNKGTSYNSILELFPTNFTIQGVNTDVSGFLTITNGMFKISGSFNMTNRIFTTSLVNIIASAGLYLNNMNFTVAAQSNNFNVYGKLVIDNGILNIGTSSNDLILRSNSFIEINGGIINIGESLFTPTSAIGFTYTQTGGILNVCTNSNINSTYGSFHVISSGNFNISGGKIVIRNPSSVPNTNLAYDYYNTAATRNITGGTVQFGDASTGAKKRFYQNTGYFPNITIDNSSGVDSVFFRKNTSAPVLEPTILLNTTVSNNTILDAGVMNACNPIFVGNVTINSGGKLTHGTSTINIGGSFTNNGTYTVTTGTANFNGGSSQTIGGTSTTSFYNLTNSNTSTGLTLGANITISNTLNMSGATANINLNGSTIDLGTTGSISGESSSDRIYGTTGSITATRTLNNVSNYDVAGTGLYITTAANMGSTVFTRKHNAYSNSQFTSILRNFQISPTTNTGLDATISVNYFDAELNGLGSQEANFELWRSTNGGSTWTERFGSENTASNSISLTHIDAFSTWTVGPAVTVVLGDQLVSFEASKNKDEVLVNWKIAQEDGIELYEVESSFDGKYFRGIGIVAAENSSRYQLEDGNYVNGINYYRLKLTSTNGEETYSSIRSVDMTKLETVLVKTVNTLGQEVGENEKGLILQIYSDGSVIKIIN